MVLICLDLVSSYTSTDNNTNDYKYTENAKNSISKCTKKFLVTSSKIRVCSFSNHGQVYAFLHELTELV